MRIWYADEVSQEITTFNVIALIVLFAGLLINYGENNAPEIWSANWYINTIITLSIIGCIIGCGRVAGKKALLYRAWHKCIVKHGKIYQGNVVEIIETETLHQTNNGLILGKHRNYQFKVRYINDIREECEFITPILAIRPKKAQKYICDVHICNLFDLNNRYALKYIQYGRVIADNFKAI